MGPGNLTRRQFGTGAAAAAAALVVPVPAIATPARAAATLDRTMIAGLDSELAIVARRMARLDKLFVHVEKHYFSNDRCRWRWDHYYGELIESAQWFYEIDREDRTEAQRHVIAWARERVPRAVDLLRQKWTPIEGLSPRFRWLELILHEALMRSAEASLPRDYVTYRGLQNPCYPEHEAIMDAYHRAGKRVTRILYGRWSGPWGWPKAERPADLILLRRVWDICKENDGIVARKFRRPALKRLRERGISWIATDNGRSDRTWTWVYPGVRVGA